MKLVILSSLIHLTVWAVSAIWIVKKIDDIKQSNFLKIQKLLENQRENNNKINFIIEKLTNSEKKIDIILNEATRDFQEQRIQMIIDRRNFNNTQ